VPLCSPLDRFQACEGLANPPSGYSMEATGSWDTCPLNYTMSQTARPPALYSTQWELQICRSEDGGSTYFRIIRTPYQITCCLSSLTIFKGRFSCLCHEGIWGSRNKAPFTPNLGNEIQLSSQYHASAALMFRKRTSVSAKEAARLASRPGRIFRREEKNLLSLLGIDTWFLCCPPPSLVAIAALLSVPVSFRYFFCVYLLRL
jgi:hypothetical protein